MVAVLRRVHVNPCAIIVEPVRNLGSRELAGTFAQHPVGKHCQQGFGLHRITAFEKKVKTHYPLVGTIELVQRYTIRHCHLMWQCQMFKRHGFDGGWLRHCQSFHENPIEVAKAFARSRSSGVSIPMVSISVTPTFIL